MARIIFETKESLLQDAAARFVALTAMSEGPFFVALSGGSTPKGLFTLLAAEPYLSAIDWSQVHLYFGDERCVPPDDERSNFRMANDTLISKVPVPETNIHRIHGELAPEAAAEQYRQEIARHLGGGMPKFDLILLGMGSDGHTASLFPGKSSLDESELSVIAAEPGLEPFVPRVTLTFPVLNGAKNVLFLVTGADKTKALELVFAEKGSIEMTPSRGVKPGDGVCDWLIDQEAYGK